LPNPLLGKDKFHLAFHSFIRNFVRNYSNEEIQWQKN